MTNQAQLHFQLTDTESTLTKYGFSFWANKLGAIKNTITQRDESEILTDISKLYGGFGTLMDLAVDPYLLPSGVTEDEANKDLSRSINDLYELVKPK